ncbi:MAG TPA: TetR/AcrR family transcriptional regulator [Myxococcota bacterium]|nr:TetR/AcrR family transcriptional regulator [Myxococcota bacterium]
MPGPNPIRRASTGRARKRATGADRREQILAEAMACFAELGFRGTTVRELASRVGLSEAALYRYFSSKESLYAAIIDRKMAAVDIVAVLRPAAERRDDREFFLGLAREIFRRVESDPTFLRILYFSALEGHRLADPFFDSRVKRLREFVTDYVARRIADGSFVAIDPVIASRAFLGMVFDHLNVRLVLGQSEAYPQPLDEVAATFVSIFLGGMKVRPAEGASS